MKFLFSPNHSYQLDTICAGGQDASNLEKVIEKVKELIE
jgi:hypothetical protein